MQVDTLGNLKLEKNKKRFRAGRGKYSRCAQKGQKSRAGSKKRPHTSHLRGKTRFYLRTKKLKVNRLFFQKREEKKLVVFSLDTLLENFPFPKKKVPKIITIDLKNLLAKHLINKKTTAFKILAPKNENKITSFLKYFYFKTSLLSKKARALIIKFGGKLLEN